MREVAKQRSEVVTLLKFIGIPLPTSFFGEIYVFKKIAQVLALVVPMFLVACGGGSSSSDTSTATMAGTYTGTVTGINAGPATFTISAANAVTGSFVITNRDADGGPFSLTVTGTTTAAGAISGYFVQSGAQTMYFTGTVNASAGTITATYTEVDNAAKGGSISLKK